MVGATKDNDAGNNAGTAFIFVLDEGEWRQEVKLLPTGLSPLNGANFGWSVAIDGETAVVGAVNSNGLTDAEETGVAYAYQSEGGVWQESALLTASDAVEFDHLGTALAISASAIMVGAPDSDEREINAGAVHIFEL